MERKIDVEKVNEQMSLNHLIFEGKDEQGKWIQINK